MFTSLKLKQFALLVGLLAGAAAGATASDGLLPQQSAVVSQVSSQNPVSPEPRTGYLGVPLEQFAESRDRLIGESPSAVVARLFGAKEALVASGFERIEVSYPQPTRAVVILTKMGLADDSVGGMRYRVELEAQPTETASQWQVTWVGQQFKCQPGRGHQAWTGELCS